MGFDQKLRVNKICIWPMRRFGVQLGFLASTKGKRSKRQLYTKPHKPKTYVPY